jgi:hypothetical protein
MDQEPGAVRGARRPAPLGVHGMTEDIGSAEEAFLPGHKVLVDLDAELRRELQTLTEERDEALLRADKAERDRDAAEERLREARGVISTNTAHQGWLETQLKASGYRERAYARIIRTAARGMVKDALEVLESGGKATTDDDQIIEVLTRQIERQHGELTSVRTGIELIAAVMEEGARQFVAGDMGTGRLIAGWAADLRDLLPKEASLPVAKPEVLPVPAPVTESDVCGC